MVATWIVGGAVMVAECVSHAGAAPAPHKAPGALFPTTRPGARPRPAFAPAPAPTKALWNQGRRARAVCMLPDRVPEDLMAEDMDLQLRVADARKGGNEFKAGPSQLVTYGDVFRQALADEVAERAEEEGRRIKPVATVAMAASKVGNGFRAMLERLVADPPPDEISKNLEAFAMQHRGVVGLPVQKETVQTKADLDRLEAVLDMELDDVFPTQPPAYLESLEESESRES